MIDGGILGGGRERRFAGYVHWYEWAPRCCPISGTQIEIFVTGIFTWIVDVGTITKTLATITFVFMLRRIRASIHFLLFSHISSPSRNQSILHIFKVRTRTHDAPYYSNAVSPTATKTVMEFFIRCAQFQQSKEFRVTMGARRWQNKTKTHSPELTSRRELCQWLSCVGSGWHKRIGIIDGKSGKSVDEIIISDRLVSASHCRWNRI